MHAPLLRRLTGFCLLVLALLTLGTRQANATHLYGGEMSYRYLDANGPANNEFRYEVSVFVYNNYGSSSLVPNGRPSVELGFYQRDNIKITLPQGMPSSNGGFVNNAGNLVIPKFSADTVTRSLPAACAQGFVPPQVLLAKYIAIVCLPVSFDGYYCFFSDAARNNGITNIQTGGGGGGAGNMTLYLDMAAPIFQNSSPVFSDTAVALICAGDTTLILNSANDPDGDRLTYSFGTPYAGGFNNGNPNPSPNSNPPSPFPQPLPSINYAATYSTALPFGPSGFAGLNANTGLSKYFAPTTGNFVVAVDVNEYRRNANGVDELIGRTRRDVQLIARVCPAGNTPVLSYTPGTGGGPGGTGSRDFFIEEGQSLSFGISGNTNPSGGALDLKINSVLLDGSGPINASFGGNQGVRAPGQNTGVVGVAGNGPLSGNFVFNSVCGQGRASSYDVLATTSVICTGKSNSQVYRVFVTKTAPPTAIAGPDVICNPGTPRTYTAQGPTPPQGYRWRVSGGAITAGQGTNTITVQWTSTAGSRFVSLKNVSSFGCLSDSVSRNVDVRPVGTLTVTAAIPTLCRGLSTTLTVASATAGLTYTWVASPGGATFTGATITVTPTATTTYTVTGTTADGVCNTQASATVTVTSPPVANAGPNRSICAGAATQLGTAPVTGLTYAWTPATGLNDPTVAQPNFGLTTPGAYAYTLTATSSPGCFSTSAVTVTVYPAPIADAGPARAICSGASAQLGTPAVTGYTYSWSPATGLNNPNIAQPTATGTATALTTVTYTLTVSLANAGGTPCSATSTTALTINPRPVLLVIAPVAICVGGTATLAGDVSQPQPLTYQWSPTTGLATPNAAVTTVTLATPGTFTYTLTATNTGTGCTSTTTAQVTVNPLPIASAGPNQTLCANTATVGTAANVGTTVFTAAPATGVSFSPTSGGTATATFPVLTVPATYVVTATVTNAATTCTSSSTATITVNPIPVAVAGPNRTVCALSQTTLGGGLPPVAGNTYSWSPTAGLNDPTSPNPVLTVPQQGQTPFTTVYTLTVTNPQNCPNTSSVTLTVNPAAAVSAGPDKRTCSGVSVQIGSGVLVPNLTFSWSPTTGLSNPITSVPSLTLTNTTGANQVLQYVVTATTALGCIATDTVLVTVNPAAVATPGPALTFCSGDSQQLGAGAVVVVGATYAWTPTTGLSNPAIPNPTVTGINNTNAPVSTTYTLTVTNPASLGSCSAAATVVVTINPQPVATPGPDRAFCAGGSAQLGTAGVAGFNYSWSPTTGLSSASIANPTVSLPNAGLTALTTVYTLTVTSATTPVCTATATVSVTVNPLPAVPATPLVFQACSGAPVTFTGLGNVAGATYLWTSATIGDLSNPTIPNPVATVTNTTGGPLVRTYTLTITNPASLGGCPASTTVTLNVNPALTVSPGTARTVCAGTPTTLGGAPVAGATYRWTPATGLSNPNIANPVLTLANNGPAPLVLTYKLRVSNTNLGLTCADSATVTVTINPKGRPTTGPALTFCSGESRTLGAAVQANTTYLWAATPAAGLAGLSSTTAANPTLTLTNTTAAPLVYTYTLTATSTFAGASCDSAATVSVTVNPRGTATLPAPAYTLCSRQPQAIGRPQVANTTYRWTPATGLSSATVANPTVTLTNNGTAAFSIVYQLVATSTFAGAACPDSATVTVTVNPKGRPTTGPALAFCSGESRTLGAAAQANTTYLWTASPAAGLAGLSSTTAANPTVTLTNTTAAPLVYTYTLTATSTLAGASCDSTATVAVTVNPAAVAQAGPDKQTCSGIAVGIGTGTAIVGTTYVWTPVVGLSNPALAAPLATLPNLGTAPIVQQYVLLATTANGCFQRDTVNVTVNPAAVAQAGPNATICSGKTAQLGGSGPAIAGSTYAWTPTTGLSNPAIFNPIATGTNLTAAPLSIRYKLTVTTGLGCVDSSFVTLTVNPAAVANAGPDLPVCSGFFTNLGGNPVGVPGTTYAWTPTTGVTNPNSPTSRVTLTNTTSAPIAVVYTLTATTASGCVATDNVTITVSPLAVADAGPDVALCDRKQVTLGTPARPNHTYLWTPAIGLNSTTAAQPVFTATNTTTAPVVLTYVVTATDNSNILVNCLSTDTVRVTVNPRPATDSIAGPASVCPTVTGIVYTIRNPRATAYQWVVTGAVAFTGNGTPAIAVDWGPAGTGSIKAYTLNSLGCSSDTVTLPIIINTRLQTVRPTGPGDVRALAPLPRSVCQADGPYTYSTVYANGSLYSWTILGGTQVSTNLASVVVSWNPVAVPTIGRIVVTETSNPASGVRCLGTSDTLRVLINPSPLTTLAITGPAAVCQGSGPATFSLPGGFVGSTYTFTLGGAALPTTGNTATLATLPAPGSYVVTARETSVAGCAGPTYTFNFTVNPTPVAVAIIGQGFVCDVALAQQYSVAATPGYTYTWTVTGGTFTPGPSSSQITVQFAAGAPAYAVSVTPTSDLGCVGSATTKTVLFDNPSVALAVSSVDLTSNTSIVLTLAAPGSANTRNAIQVLRRVAGVGNFVVVGTVPASATTYTDNAGVDAAANSYEYQLSLTNGCGTTVSSVATQTVRLVAAATPGTGGRNQGTTALSWNAYIGFAVTEYRILRSADGGAETLVATVTGSTLLATVPNAPGGSASGAGFNQQFRVVAVGPGSLLSNSNTANTRFENPIVTYNVITPNNDGLNDVLVIDNITLYPGNEFTIFNRWGREVYRTTNYQNNWGGDANTASGNYYFLLKMADGSSKKGWFEVIK